MRKTGSFALIKKMMGLIKGQRKLIVLAVTVGTLGFFSAMGITFFAALAILHFVETGATFDNTFVLYCALTLAFGFARGGLRYLEQYLNHYMAFTLLALIRDKIFASLERQGSKVLDDKERGAILSIIQSDVETMEVFYAHTITPFFIALAVETVVFLALFFLAGWPYALVSLFANLIIGIVVPIFFYKANKKDGRRYREVLSSSESTFLDMVYGIDEAIYFSRGEKLIKEVENASHSLNTLNRRLQEKSAKFSALAQLFIVIADIAIVALGGLLIHYDFASSSVIVAYAILAASFGPTLALASLPSNLTMSFASAERVFAILDAPTPIKEGDKDFDFERLEVRGVSFGYGQKEVLKDASFSIQKGEIIGIEGKSGSGKSTLLKLLLHFEEASKGIVTYNDEPISSFSRESIAKNVTLFSQSTHLFKGTFAYNLRIAAPACSDIEMKEACKAAGILSFIENCPKGFETEISEIKENISSGEKQRLGLARVFLAKSPLLLLDEATSNIDAYNEALILNELKKRKDDLAIILVSHRPSTLSISDRVYSLADGVLTQKSAI